MEANELRIGNYIIDTFDVQNIQEGIITFDDFQVMANFSKSGSPIPYKPIPLTEEWLLKLGFDDDLNGWYAKDYFTERDEDNLIRLSVNLTSHRCSINQLPNDDDMNDTGPAYTGIGVKYVHQLQNLYFALTQTELTVK